MMAAICSVVFGAVVLACVAIMVVAALVVIGSALGIVDVKVTIEKGD